MPEINHAKELRAKLFAEKYFEEFITKDEYVNPNKNTEDLYKAYMFYYDLYINNANDYRKFEIETAYKYLFYILEGQKRFKNTGELVTNLSDSYDGLIKRISEYSFISKNDNSYSEKQNITNSNILNELSSFKIILSSTINNLSLVINKYDSKEKIDIYYVETNRRIEELIKRIQNASFELDKAKDNYYNVWNIANSNKLANRYVNYSELGEAKKRWKKRRNDACYELINLFKELNKINEDTLIYIWIAEQKEELIDSFKTTSDVLDYNLQELEKSKNYYCFLSETEKEKLDKKNKELKLKRKATNQ